MENLLFSSILLLIFGITLSSCAINNNSKFKPYLICFECFILCISSIAFYRVTVEGPKAIDVYRGAAQLEITKTYRDSIVIEIDSTVVYKK